MRLLRDCASMLLGNSFSSLVSCGCSLDIVPWSLFNLENVNKHLCPSILQVQSVCLHVSLCQLLRIIIIQMEKHVHTALTKQPPEVKTKCWN